MHSDLFWYWFVNIPGIGLQARTLLLDHFHSPQNIWEQDIKVLQSYLTKKQLQTLLKSKNEASISISYTKLQEQQIKFITPDSQLYPEKLRHIPQPPNSLYLKGCMPPINEPLLGVVGTRRPTPYGRDMTKQFIKALSAAGIHIVSGLAAGIDTISHQSALEAKTYTMGVLGGGIDSIYPRENFNLYRRMYQFGGVLSEYNAGIPNLAGLFPERNRIISGMSDAILIIEAAEKSGSLITADHALEQGKEIYVIPGRITDSMSAGCNHLISQGAHLVTSPNDIIDDLKDIYSLSVQTDRMKLVKISNPEFENALEAKIYDSLDNIHPLSVNQLLSILNKEESVNLNDIMNQLMRMEIKQTVTRMHYGLYVRNSFIK